MQLAGTGTISHLARRVCEPSLSQPGGHIIIYRTCGVQGNQGYGKRKVRVRGHGRIDMRPYYLKKIRIDLFRKMLF